MASGGRVDGIEYAQRVDAAAELVGAGVPVAGAARELADRFGVSPRQARRYAEQAMAAGRVEVPEASVVFTVKLPGSLADRVRTHAREREATISAVVASVLDDAVATQDTVTQLISAVRRVIREVPGALEVVEEYCTAHDYADPGKPKIAWNDAQAREVLVDALVTDAHRVLGHLPEREHGPGAADALGLLALVAGQDVEVAEGSDGRDGRWRIARRTVYDRVVSTVDPEARHIHKNRTRRQDGYRAHVAFEPEAGLFTGVALTGGAAVAKDLLAGEDGNLTVLGDTAYSAGELREHLRNEGHDAVLKPPPLTPAVPGGFTLEDFAIETTAGQVTCPAGHTRPLGRAAADGTRQAQFKALCATCPLAPRCTRSKTGRVLSGRGRKSFGGCAEGGWCGQKSGAVR
jgi:Transposase DDE domain